MTAAHCIAPVAGPLDATVTLPGSKSITNRALVCAALADGPSTLTGALLADDTEAMADALVCLGIDVERHGIDITVGGRGGLIPEPRADIDARQSGTTARFLAPVLALGTGPYRLDGAPQLRSRPMGPGFGALRGLGATVEEDGFPGALPVRIEGGPVAGGEVALTGNVSSQFASGLLLAAPAMRKGLHIELKGAVVSRPYLALTRAVMAGFGVEVGPELRVAGTGYAAARLAIEPDASAASYFFAAAAIVGGRVTVPGLGAGSAQGDMAFVDVLERMGATVERGRHATTVVGTGTLHGVEVDMEALSDTAPTLAAVAVFADSPTRVTGVGFIRAKESDRIGNVVSELRRCGVRAEEEADGFVIHPGAPEPATVQTYDDHRIAMSFALLGLRADGIAIADPGCVAKTFPGFFSVLEALGR